MLLYLNSIKSEIENCFGKSTYVIMVITEKKSFMEPNW